MIKPPHQFQWPWPVLRSKERACTSNHTSVCNQDDLISSSSTGKKEDKTTLDSGTTTTKERKKEKANTLVLCNLCDFVSWTISAATLTVCNAGTEERELMFDHSTATMLFFFMFQMIIAQRSKMWNCPTSSASLPEWLKSLGRPSGLWTQCE